MIREATVAIRTHYRYACPVDDCPRASLAERPTEPEAVDVLKLHVRRRHPELIVRRSAAGKVQVCSVAGQA